MLRVCSRLVVRPATSTRRVRTFATKAGTLGNQKRDIQVSTVVGLEDIKPAMPNVDVGKQSGGSTYCPYDETSKQYDQTRKPLGLNVFLGSYVLAPWPVHSQSLLDVGCGTGTFLETMQGKFGSLSGLEYSDGMIAQAKARLGPDVNLVQGSADNLPFEDASFHAISINQVVHHFPPDNNFAFLARTFKEAARVLMPGGIFVINTSTPEQQRDAFWWVELFDHSEAVICSRFPPLDVVLEHLGGAGFQVNDDSVCVPLHRSLMASDKYLEKGIACGLEKNYQDGDSSWAMAEKFGEIPQVMQKINDMVAQGKDSHYLLRKEQQRKSMGQATFVTAIKQ